MINTRTLSVAEIEEFLNASKTINFSATNKTEVYNWIENLIVKLRYWKLERTERGVVRRYLVKMTGYSKSQIDRLIGVWREHGHVKKVSYKRNKFPKIYQREDLVMLAETDKLFGILSGPATVEIMRREYEIFHHDKYAKLAGISVSHLYNLRGDFVYKNIVKFYQHTKPATVPIGLRHKPAPDGKPGYIRVDSVHQGDDPYLGKSVYHINLVDEVTQSEMVICVPQITERYLAPAIKAILLIFPFVIIEFHSDNGSEFINRVIADILNRLNIVQSKSRPRHSNDNGLVETKNNAIIRKEMGYGFIQKAAFKLIDQYYNEYFNIYLNYHRPCAFVTVITDKRGKEHKIYKTADYTTPYEKLKSLPNAEQYLKHGITFAKLDEIAYGESDVEFARKMRVARAILSAKIKEQYLRDNILQEY